MSNAVYITFAHTVVQHRPNLQPVIKRNHIITSSHVGKVSIRMLTASSLAATMDRILLRLVSRNKEKIKSTKFSHHLLEL